MKRAKVIAYYLPQYHPIKENNEWWGPGFTEWTIVAKARPLFKGHVQPKIPADLGFYDLRLAESRDLQAELARQAGIDAFCYWHYWFGNGKQLLEKPLQLVVESGHPDFPFCLGWANHDWRKKMWNAETSFLDQTVLMKVSYPGKEDIEAHFYRMLPMFKDRRYYTISDKLVFLIYDIMKIPYLEAFMALWQKLAEGNRLPPFCFMALVRNKMEMDYARNYAFDFFVYENRSEAMASHDVNVRRVKNMLSSVMKKCLNVMDYADFIKKIDYQPVHVHHDIIPTIYPNWDTTPRRGYGGEILKNATPELFRQHAEHVLKLMDNRKEDDRIIFLKSWNEWGEGNYLEPDLEYGRQRIEALHQAIYE